MNNALTNLFMDNFKEQADFYYDRLKFDNDETKKDIDSLIDLANKLGKLIATIANNSDTMQGKDIVACISSHVYLGMHEDLDHDKDYRKFIEAEEAEDDDDEDEEESIPELIERVLKELRNL